MASLSSVTVVVLSGMGALLPGLPFRAPGKPSNAKSFVLRCGRETANPPPRRLLLSSDHRTEGRHIYRPSGLRQEELNRGSCSPPPRFMLAFPQEIRPWHAPRSPRKTAFGR